MKDKLEKPYYPIIYVRGYAMTRSEMVGTASTPYMGFNEGSTRIRQDWQGTIQKHIFESPLIRLMKDYGYRDVYENGMEFKQDIGWKSLIIHRYYDEGDPAFGSGIAPSIESAARGLKELISQTRKRICGNDIEARSAFKVYLVAHSMGGLVVRCFLQNLASDEERLGIEKIFTYATPHNGIEMLGFNVPEFLGPFDINNFNRKRMAGYLGLPPDSHRVDTLNGTFDPGKFFCLVGTNHRDYDVAMGLSRKGAGSLSDGLVRIKNATIQGAPRAFVHRSHSGPYGIVNSEEGYQNLRRFFFGNLKAVATLNVRRLPLPPKVEKAHREGKKVRASYYFEASVATRGSIHCLLTERSKRSQSAIFRSFDQLLRSDAPRMPVLFSVFLDTAHITSGRTVVFQLDLAVSTTGYEIDNKLWFDEHLPEENLFRDVIALRAVKQSDNTWKLRYNLTDNDKWGSALGKEAQGLDNGAYRIVLESKKGFSGHLDIHVTPS